MNNNGPDLFVEASELTKLAKEQQDAAVQITDAKNDINGLVGGLTKDHGLICTSLVNAMRALEEVRVGASDNLAQVSSLLAENLNTAADTYTTTDEHTSRNIDKQMQR